MNEEQKVGGAMLALVAGLTAAPAYAQVVADNPGATPDQDIIVTGSRIRRSPLDQDKPVVTVDQAAIARTGLSSVADGSRTDDTQLVDCLEGFFNFNRLEPERAESGGDPWGLMQRR